MLLPRAVSHLPRSAVNSRAGTAILVAGGPVMDAPLAGHGRVSCAGLSDSRSVIACCWVSAQPAASSASHWPGAMLARAGARNPLEQFRGDWCYWRAEPLPDRRCDREGIGRHGRGHLTVHLPEGWYREHVWMNLFTATCGPPQERPDQPGTGRRTRTAVTACHPATRPGTTDKPPDSGRRYRHSRSSGQ
jgi:hypothetical protein